MDAVRIDRWLAAARFFASRTQATAACEGGAVRINGAKVKAHQKVRVGDEVVARVARGKVVIDVLLLAEKRLSPARARELYRDRSAPHPPRDPWLGWPLEGERSRDTDMAGFPESPGGPPGMPLPGTLGRDARVNKRGD
jgi:ribosome-associated heat shock protein Hsp15